MENNKTVAGMLK